MNTAVTGAGKMHSSAQTGCVFHPPGNCSFRSPPYTTELGGALLEKLTFEIWHFFLAAVGSDLRPATHFIQSVFVWCLHVHVFIKALFVYA